MALDPEVVARLAKYFYRNGYIRRPNPARRKAQGRLYKKGDEVRLVAKSPAELRDIQRLLKRAGFPIARPYPQANGWRQPVYGAREVARFLSLVASSP